MGLAQADQVAAGCFLVSQTWKKEWEHRLFPPMQEGEEVEEEVATRPEEARLSGQVGPMVQQVEGHLTTTHLADNKCLGLLIRRLTRLTSIVTQVNHTELYRLFFKRRYLFYGFIGKIYLLP